MKKLLVSLIFLTQTAFAFECNHSAKGSAELVEVFSGIHTVKGSLSGFDPCNKSVKLSIPKTNKKPPLLIYLHGGGGLNQFEKNGLAMFREKGIATLEFDAYQMNGLDKDGAFWAYKVTNGARQRMIFSAGLAAYEWSKTLKEIDTDKIYFYGLSNGASAAVNIAAVVDPSHVKGVFAEGTAGMGLGLPDALKVPVKLIYGKLDNYGSRKEDLKIWERTASCRFNDIADNIPLGNSKNCNVTVSTLEQETESPISWYNRLKQKGASVDIWFFNDAAHGIMIGTYVNKKSNVYGNNIIAYTWTGADHSVKTKLVNSIVSEIN